MPAAHAKFGVRRSIAGRLLLWFLVISLVPCAVLTTITARSASHAREEAVRNNLIQLAAERSNELETYAVERIADATMLATGPIVISGMKAILSGDPARAAEATASIGDIAARFGYLEFLLLDAAGTIRYSLTPEFKVSASVLAAPLSTTELASGCLRSKALLQTDLTAFQTYTDPKAPIAFVTSPILADGRVIGVLAAGIGAERVWHVLSNMSGLGETGEIVVGEQLGDSVRITAPLRHSTDAAFQMKIPLGGGAGRGSQLAASGQRGDGVVQDYRGNEVVAAWCYLPSYRWGMNVKQDSSEAFAEIRNQRQAILWLSLATVLGVALTAMVVARSISRPLQTAVAVARQVAAGDLRATVGEHSNDETGSLLDAIQTMTNDLRGLISRIQGSSVTLDGIASAIQATSAQQQRVVADLGGTTSDAVSAVTEITATSEELSRTMAEVNTLAAKSGEKAVEGRKDLAGMDATMRTLDASTASISGKLAKISERAASITSVITTVVKVADQTNLLSINAALEAEKAGEHGLGFRVVAREITRLADQTAEASLDIERMVKEMQKSVTAGVKEMGDFSNHVSGGVREIGVVSEKLGEIITSVQAISARFGSVAQGMEAQTQGAQQIRLAMSRLSDGASRTAGALDESNKATVELRASVSELKSEVSRFTV